MTCFFFFARLIVGPEPYTSRRAMQRSRFDMRGADAGAGGMSISSGSGGASWHGRVVLAFVVGLFCHRPHRRTLLSWVWCDVPGEEIIAGMERPRPLRLHPGKLRRCGRAVDAIPCSRHCPRPRCPRLRELPILLRTGAAMLCSWPSLRRSRR